MFKKSVWIIIVLPVISIIIIITGCVSPASEKQPLPEKTISPETEAKILFLENFGSGIRNWGLEEGWYPEKIGNNTVLKGRGHKWARLKNKGWDNYTVRAKFRLIQGTIHFNFRHNELKDGPHRYFTGVKSEVVYLCKQSGDTFYDLAGVTLMLNNEWHEIEIKGYGDTLNIYIDNILVILYKDDNPILSGSIAFETLDNSEFLIDDVEIRETLPGDIATRLTPVRIHNASKKGTLTRDEIWSGEIHITDHISVPKGVILTIEPGTVVKFKHYRGYKEPWIRPGLNVKGTIKAIGTPERQIWFTSDAEDPINGDWRGIKYRIVDVRLIFATNKDLQKLVNEHQFRGDLYYRIKEVEIRIPPLRERKEDIPLLTRHFLDQISGEIGAKIEIDKEVFDLFMSYNWAGNVRELRNCLASAAAMCEKNCITVHEVSKILLLTHSGTSSAEEDLNYREMRKKILEDFDRKYINNYLAGNQGNITKTAKALGIDKKNLWMLIKKYNIDCSLYK
jgi:hypothetical protein